jgi:uncharacterized protein (DUF885 family)
MALDPHAATAADIDVLGADALAGALPSRSRRSLETCMQRREFMAASVALAVAGALGRSVHAAPASEADRARALYEEVFDEVLAVAPQAATALGLDTGPRAAARSRLNDRSPAGRLGPLGPLARAWPRLQSIDAQRLDGRGRVALETVKWVSAISREVEAQPFGTVDSYNYPVPYVVSQLTGAYQSTPDFLGSRHPIESAADAEAYLARLAAFAAEMGHDTARARDDMTRGFVPPDFIADKTLAQLQRLRGQAAAQSGLVQSLVRRTSAKGIGGDWGQRATRVVDGPLARALDEQIAMVSEQRSRATHEAGIRGRPGGEAYYQLCLRYQTSTRLTPDEAHALGLAQVAEISAAADELLKTQGLTDGPVGARLSALTTDPRWLYPNSDAGRAELIADLNRQVAAMERRLPEFFAVLPRTPVEVRRVPPDIELGAPRGYAVSGSLDGSRPGAYYINLSDTALWPKWALPTLTYHESLPGHHLQGAIALEAAGTPLLFKTLLMNAYIEGWGLYAEQLADEAGMYREFPLGRLGMLQSFLYRAVRIVVDTGMHWQGWSRERAAAYMSETVGLARGAVESEIDRYCVWPGQACGYKIGHLEFVRLRAAAQAKLGARFDLRGFHDAVLKGGAMPLEVLARVVDDWTASV